MPLWIWRKYIRYNRFTAMERSKYILKTSYIPWNPGGLVKIELPLDSKIVFASPTMAKSKITNKYEECIEIIYYHLSETEKKQLRGIIFIEQSLIHEQEFDLVIIKHLPPIWHGGELSGTYVKYFVFEVEV